MKNCSVVDLFCGIGGLTHGLLKAGLQVVAGIDIDETCKFAYEYNNNAIFINKDIKEISSSEINNLFLKDKYKILVGCAPCQPFSRYTLRYRRFGVQSCKWFLLNDFIRIINDVKPDIISMENVCGLIKENIFNRFINNLSNNGYYVSWKIVNCADYGIPQNRKRLVLLASLLKEINLIQTQYDKNNYVTVRDTISNLPILKDGETDSNDCIHCAAKLSSINLERIKQSLPSGSWNIWDKNLLLNCHKKQSGKTYSSVYGRMEWDKPSPTITTQFYGYGNGRFGHPEQNRALSLREGALLQSFPYYYKFIPDNYPVIKRIIGAHIGNAVPVKLGTIIGKSIIKHLNW